MGDEGTEREARAELIVARMQVVVERLRTHKAELVALAAQLRCIAVEENLERLQRLAAGLEGWLQDYERYFVKLVNMVQVACLHRGVEEMEHGLQDGDGADVTDGMRGAGRK